MFTDDIILEDLKKICRKSKFYKIKKFDDEFYEIDYYMKIIYIELFKKLFLSNFKHQFNKDDFEKYDLTYFFPELKDKNIKEKYNGKSNVFNK